VERVACEPRGSTQGSRSVQGPGCRTRALGAPGEARLFVLRLFFVGLGVAAFGFFPGTGLHGQGWTADFQAGQASYETAPLDSRSTNAILGVRHQVDQRFFQTAVAAPLSSGDLFWGVVSIGERLAFRKGVAEVGLDGTGLFHVHRDPAVEGMGGGGRAEFLPVLSMSTGALVTQLRSGVSLYRGEAGGERWSRDLHLSDVDVFLPLGPQARVGGELRHLRTGDEAYTFLGSSASSALGRGGIWGAVGTWISGLPADAPALGWSAGGSLGVAPGTDLWLTVRREPFDPVFLGSARTSWGVGMSHRLGRARTPPPAAGAEYRSGGTTVLRLPMGEASRPPSVAGDFSQWEALPMHRFGAHWRIELDLAPGVYHFAFRHADGTWFVPTSTPNRREDGMGGWVAVLVVPGDSADRSDRGAGGE
jgi:hypothetical protein